MEQSKRISRKVISALLSLLMVLSCFSGMSLTAYAAPTETLLTTITGAGSNAPTATSANVSYSTEGVATLTFSEPTSDGQVSYQASPAWGWWGYAITLTVTPAEGYTITKCVFYDDKDRTATDSEAPFVVETTELDKTPKVNGTPILANQSKGIKKIEVYGYATPTHTHSFTYSADGATLTATCSAEGCDLTDNKATLKIAAPDNLTYDKSAKAAIITDANAIQGTAKVQYQTKSGDAYGEATETAPTNAGTYKASITVGGATASVEYTIAKATPTYTVPTGLTATYGQTLKDVTLPTGWTWADNTASVGNAGTNTFKANFTPADTANYNTVNNIDVTVTVAKANQTAPAAPTEASKTINSITLNTIPNGEYKCDTGDWQTSPTFTGLTQNKTYTFRQRYAADANHNASAGSAEVVIRTANHTHSFTYSSSNGTITATCNGAGTCDLTDNKVSFTLTAPTSLVYDGTDKKATLEGVDAFNAATGLNVSANDIIYNDLTNVVTETKNAGTYQALYTLQTDFPRPFVGITFTVAKANPTANDFIFSEPDNLNYDGNNKTATVIPQVGVDGMGDATVKYFSDAARTNEVDYAKNAGTYYVGITVNEGDNYNATSAVLYDSSWKFTVAKANPTANDFVFSEPDNLNYNGNNKTATVIPQDGVDGMGDATVKYYSDAARTNEVDYAKNTGTYYVGITVNEGDNYNATSAVLYDSSWKFTVAKANPTYEAPKGLYATYGDTLADVALPTGWAWVDDTTSVGDAGTKTFKANYTPADTTNYNTVENVDVTVKVNQAEITPTVTLEGWAYGDTAKTPVVTGNSGGGMVTYTYATKNSDNFSATVPTNAGNYTVKATIAATTNYNGKTVTADFTIAKADIAPTVSLNGWTYGTGANTPVVDGNTENGNVTYTYAVYGSDSFSGAVPADAGEYTVKATIAATANYNGATATADFTIAKADIAPTVSIEGWTYGQEANAPSVSGNTGNGAVTYTYATKDSDSFSATVPTNAGNYTVKATVVATTNYNGGAATAEFTIAKADSVPATVTANKLTCDGTEKALVTVTGEVAGGEMQYALGKDAQTVPEDGWSTDIPAATNTGTYFVWYKVAADGNHNDSTPVCVEVTIDPNYTVKEVTGLSGNGKDEWTKGGEDGVVITVKDSGEDNSFDHFTGVKLDGQLLTKDVDYTVTKSSTIVTLLPATLEKLSVGEHTVTVLFDNGEVNTDLTVKAANSGSATSPQTGDNSHMGLWIAIMILALCGLAATLFIGKKKRVFDR